MNGLTLVLSCGAVHHSCLDEGRLRRGMLYAYKEPNIVVHISYPMSYPLV